MAVAILTFVGAFALIFGAYWFAIGEPETRAQQSLKRRLKAEDPELVRANATVKLLKQEQALSGIDLFNVILGSFGAALDPVRTFVDNSGLPTTVGTFLLSIATMFMLVLLGAILYFPVWWIDVLAALTAASIPYLVVSYFGSARVAKFEEQFPEAIELIARAMRAGHAFTTGIRIAADELPEPAGPEFRLLYERQNYGAAIPDALRAFAERIPTIDARFFVTAVLTQREAGGNLSEILDRLASVMRERFRIRREVRVRSAHGRITAYILAAMPPVLAVLMLLANPTQMMSLANDPLGVRLLLAGAVLQVLGVLLVRKIVDIQY
jgi:tight adherence protein B